MREQMQSMFHEFDILGDATHLAMFVGDREALSQMENSVTRVDDHYQVALP